MSPPQGWGISAGSWFPGLTAFASFYRAYSAMKLRLRIPPKSPKGATEHSEGREAW
jgi:hypothetical protein